MLVPAAGILAYLNSFSGTFQFDDRRAVLDDPRILSLEAFTGHLAGMIRPLVKLTFVVDRQLFGVDPAGYHALNVLLHAGSALLVLAILALVLRPRSAVGAPGWTNEGGDDERQSAERWLPLLAALLFAVHPIATETVTYVSGRATGLASFFTLASVWLGLRATVLPMARGRFLAHAAGAVGSFVLALASKETAIIAPACLLLASISARLQPQVERAPMSSAPALPGAVREGPSGPREVHASLDSMPARLPTIAMHAVLWAIALAFASTVLWHPRYATLLQASLATRSPWQNLLTEANACWYALLLFVDPRRLNFDHDLPVATSLFEWPTLASVLALAALALFAVWSMRRRPVLVFGIGWFLVALLPAHSVVARYDVLSERNLYLPGVGVFVAAAWLAVRLAQRIRARSPILSRSCLAACALLLVGCAGMTLERNRLYRDEVSLWADAASKSPLKARTHENLGYALRMRGDLDEAIREYRLALALDAQNVLARRNLLEAWEEKKRLGVEPRLPSRAAAGVTR